MKQLLSITIFIISSLTVYAQSNHIEQSIPFENVLLSMKLDSISLFMSSFSERIINREYDENVWVSRLNQGKEKLEKRFGVFQLSDFSYAFERKNSRLIIYFKHEEPIEMKVVDEGGVWKLDEK